MDKLTVSVKKCYNYDDKELDQALETCLGKIYGFDELVKKSKKILLKPNLLSVAEPDKAITTNPFFIEAIVRKILSLNGNNPENIILADSSIPVVPYSKRGLKELYKKTKMTAVSEKYGISLNMDNTVKRVSIPDGFAVKSIEVIKPVVDCDLIINLPKFKTHDLVIFTGAVKNMFGIIPGMAKPGYHTRFFELDMFCNFLIDVSTGIKPQFSIMDGIIGMEGNGPGKSGIPRNINLIIAGNDCFAVDNVASNIIGLEEDDSPIMSEAKKRGLKGAFMENIEVIGEKMEDIFIEDFLFPKTKKTNIPDVIFLNAIKRFAKNSLNPYPHIDYMKCTNCKICFHICPRKAIIDRHLKKKNLVFDYKECIRCFCCSEACPEGAIEHKYSFIGDLIINKYGLGRRK